MKKLLVLIIALCSAAAMSSEMIDSYKEFKELLGSVIVSSSSYGLIARFMD